MKKVIMLLLAAVVAVKGFGQSHDTFQVHFELNNTKLTQRATDFIDRLIFRDVLIHGQKLIVLGYADYLGGNAHNDSLSSARAKSVKDYLVNSGFDPKDITVCMGKGEIVRAETGKTGYARDRKVQIIIDRGRPPVPAKSTSKTGAKDPSKDIPVMDAATVKVNETIRLNHIHFEGGMSIILPESEPELARLVQFMASSNTLKIRIEGHVCCMGPVPGTDDNYLSWDRAKAIFDYLVAKGISKERLSYIGLGNTNPVAKEELTEADRTKNRRVEIRILSK